ncbi:MAG: phosphate ABC transporter permease PstA [Acidothermus cellulolyticus]|nr:phosphate ABC transporter permease PstA [Acidothermus cellulolyticus]
MTASSLLAASKIQRRTRSRLVSGTMSLLIAGAFLLAAVPLFLVVGYTLSRGVTHFSWIFFSHSLAGVPPSQPGGGIAAATIGTIEQVGIATLVSVPLGLAAAIYLAEYGVGTRFAGAVSFLVDVMTGVPSIVAGLFVYAFFVISLHRGFSGLAAALALSILMLPVVIRSSQDMIAAVPTSLREAGYALGLRRWRVIAFIVLPTARSGLVTGVMLAVARVCGETAPLLLTAFDNAYINTNPLHGQQSALPLVIFNQAQQAYQPAVDRAWAAAATLILAIVTLYITARLLARRRVGGKSG